MLSKLSYMNLVMSDVLPTVGREGGRERVRWVRTTPLSLLATRCTRYIFGVCTGKLILGVVIKPNHMVY